MSSADDALDIGANLCMVMMLVTVVLCSARMLSDANLKINNLNVKAVYDNVNCFSPYENKVVTGDKVRQFIDIYKDSLFIRVSAESFPEGIFGDDLENMRDIESVYCIAQTGEFYCTLLRDKNGDVIGANFEQTGVNLTDEELRHSIVDCDNKLNS